MKCINASTGVTAWVDEGTNSDFATISDCGQVIAGNQIYIKDAESLILYRIN